jgi:hypothetical protein
MHGAYNVKPGIVANSLMSPYLKWFVELCSMTVR